jgi:hypothetical protein
MVTWWKIDSRLTVKEDGSGVIAKNDGSEAIEVAYQLQVITFTRSSLARSRRHSRVGSPEKKYHLAFCVMRPIEIDP